MLKIYKLCSECGTPITDAIRITKQLCSNKCAVRKHRRIKKESQTGVPQCSIKSLREEVSEMQNTVAELLAMLKPSVLEIAYKYPELLARAPKYVRDQLTQPANIN